METSAERFFKGFSLEDYRLQVLVNRLEKEKKQCLNRLREETHVFKMSVRPPVKSGEECWSQYGEIFHANGDKRDTGSITHVNMDHNKEDAKNTEVACQDSSIDNQPKPHSSPTVQSPSDSSQHCSRASSHAAQRTYSQRIRNRRNNRKKDSKNKSKPPDLTLLEILCADFENGTLLAKRTESQSRSSLKNSSINLGREHAKKVHTTGLEKKTLFSDSDKSVKFTGNPRSNAQSRSGKNGIEAGQSGEAGDSVGSSKNSISGSKPISFEGLSSDNSSPKESSISEWCLSSQETVTLGDGMSAQKLNWTSEDSTNNLELREIGTSLQSTAGSQLNEGNYSKPVKNKSSAKLSASDNARKNENKSILSNHLGLGESGLEVQTSENCRFVHFKEGRKPSRKKGKKESCVDRSKGKDKLNRTRSSGVKLYQVDGLQSSQRRKSQEEIDKETRQKMDQFFAKVDRTKSFQTARPRWRCNSGVDPSARRIERKTLEPGRRPHGAKKEHGYRRAQPWPTQVWS